MNFYEYKQSFVKERFFDLQELNVDEVAKIPKESNKAVYDYVQKNNMIYDENKQKYYKKIYIELSDDEIDMYTNMVNIRLEQNILKELQKNNKLLSKIKVVLSYIQVVPFFILILIIVLLFG